MLALIAVVAGAAEPMVYGGDPEVALARVAQATGRPESAFAAVAVADLRDSDPTSVGATLTTCVGPTATGAQLEWTIKRAEGAVAYGEYEQAAKELGEAERLATCLAEPTDAAVVARASLLRGVERAGADPVAAREAFADALATGATAAWDDSWPASARAIYDEVAARKPGAVDLVVHAPEATIHLDGRPLASGEHASVGAGMHRVLIGTATPLALSIDAAQGPVTIVIPAAYPADLLADAHVPDRRVALTALFAGAFGEGAAAIIATDDAIWAATAGRTDWVALGQVSASPAQRAGRAIAIGGGVVTLGGGLATAIMYGKTSSASESMTDSASTGDFRAAESDYLEARKRYAVARFVPIAGLAIFAVGVGVSASSDAEVVFSAWPAGASIGVRW